MESPGCVKILSTSTTPTPTSVAARTFAGSTIQFQRVAAKLENAKPSSGIEPR